eukprot:TRINITY_DN8011_c0_g1_i1.p1 TRINITY_DN8011_c0_g1~~TRINITY_DN8011_c0_g1_i1.p1  ORF type:complete len:100 (+),score=0.27 TRINITY_DN8011_c0_g1_i1:135-434(+)
MKAVNKIVRSSHMTEEDKIEYLVNTHGQTEERAKKLLRPCEFFGKFGFDTYALQNSNANIRTTRKRLDLLEALHNEAPLQGNGKAMGTAWELYKEEGRH